MENNKQTDKVKTCLVCNSENISTSVEIIKEPVYCNVLWPTYEQAVSAPTGDIKLGFCLNCGHVFNTAFNSDATKYDQNYENSLHYSPKFQKYTEILAGLLIEKYDLHDKDIIEIGCGKGDFLTLLCELGGNRGVGFDTSYDHNRTGDNVDKSIRFINDFYSGRYANYKADIICCRHVLEHIIDPYKFLMNIRNVSNNRNINYFFEVPNVLYTLKDLGIWDLIYEHCSYFSKSSISRLFTLCGFEILALDEKFEGQFITIEARLYNKGINKDNLEYNEKLKEMAQYVKIFSDRYNKKLEKWKFELEKTDKLGQKVVIWGGGSKGVTFLNRLKTHNQIDYVVDLNPHKHNKFVPGTGQKIVPPEFLCQYRPEVIFIMNPVYFDEIQEITKNMNVEAKLLTL